jgi:hypothetical protein
MARVLVSPFMYEHCGRVNIGEQHGGVILRRPSRNRGTELPEGAGTAANAAQAVNPGAHIFAVDKISAARRIEADIEADSDTRRRPALHPAPSLVAKKVDVASGMQPDEPPGRVPHKRGSTRSFQLAADMKPPEWQSHLKMASERRAAFANADQVERRGAHTVRDAAMWPIHVKQPEAKDAVVSALASWSSLLAEPMREQWLRARRSSVTASTEPSASTTVFAGSEQTRLSMHSVGSSSWRQSLYEQSTRSAAPPRTPSPGSGIQTPHSGGPAGALRSMSATPDAGVHSAATQAVAASADALPECTTWVLAACLDMRSESHQTLSRPPRRTSSLPAALHAAGRRSDVAASRRGAARRATAPVDTALRPPVQPPQNSTMLGRRSCSSLPREVAATAAVCSRLAPEFAGACGTRSMRAALAPCVRRKLHARVTACMRADCS